MRRRNACQFSFICEGHPLGVSEGQSWNRAVRIARALTRTETIGHRVFYTLKPGQT